MPSKGNQSDLVVVGLMGGWAGLIEVACCVAGWLCEARMCSSNRRDAADVHPSSIVGRRGGCPPRPAAGGSIVSREK